MVLVDSDVLLGVSVNETTCLSQKATMGDVETGMTVDRRSRPMGGQRSRDVIHDLSLGEDVNFSGSCEELTLSHLDSWLTGHGGVF